MNEKHREAEEGPQRDTLQENRAGEAFNPFKEAQSTTGEVRSPEEEADAEQQYKEALTERD